MTRQLLVHRKILRSVDVGAVIDRPRANTVRPYERILLFFVFCNKPFSYNQSVWVSL